MQERGGGAMADARRINPEVDDYSEQMLVCIQNCQDCYRACLQTFAYCLKRGGRHAAAELLRGLLDCADICLTSAGFMIRNSDLHAPVCAACADVCQSCSARCADLGDDRRMKALTDTCAHCAESCREMARDASSRSRDPVPARGPRRGGAVLTRRKTD